MIEILYKFRFVFVIALLGLAACMATEKGKLPLALRGLRQILHRDAGVKSVQKAEQSVPLWRRLAAFAMVILSFVIACL